MSAAVIVAVSCVLLIYVVGRGLPFHSTSASLAKFVPLTVSVRPEPPAVAEAGLRLVNVGVLAISGCTDFSKSISAWGVLVGTPVVPTWSLSLMPWQAAQTRISPGCIVTQMR